MNPSINDIAGSLEELMPSVEREHTDQDVLSGVSFEVESERLKATDFQFRRGLEYGFLEMLSRWEGLHGASPLDSFSNFEV
jgi:hypothetical protein